MKSLIKKIYRSKFSVYLRNLIDIRPQVFLIEFKGKNRSSSDAFFWRTDNNYYTVFKFSDILKLFFDDDSGEVEILFYDKNNNLIKTKNYSNIELSNKIIIDKSFFNGLEDYGVFYIFHRSLNNITSIIRNSCYTGYSFNKNLPSFVHGNLITSTKSFDGKSSNFGIIGISKFKKKIYKIQNFYNFEKTEIAIMNPTKKKLEIEINSKKYILGSCCSKIIDNSSDDIIKIVSNCYLLRPIIFNYQNSFIDVYHG